jgi:hypothetical protein
MSRAFAPSPSKGTNAAAHCIGLDQLCLAPDNRCDMGTIAFAGDGRLIVGTERGIAPDKAAH